MMVNQGEWVYRTCSMRKSNENCINVLGLGIKLAKRRWVCCAAVSLLRQLVTSHSPWRCRFIPRLVQMGCVVDGMALGQGFLEFSSFHLSGFYQCYVLIHLSVTSTIWSSAVDTKTAMHRLKNNIKTYTI